MKQCFDLLVVIFLMITLSEAQSVPRPGMILQDSTGNLVIYNQESDGEWSLYREWTNPSSFISNVVYATNTSNDELLLIGVSSQEDPYTGFALAKRKGETWELSPHPKFEVSYKITTAIKHGEVYYVVVDDGQQLTVMSCATFACLDLFVIPVRSRVSLFSCRNMLFMMAYIDDGSRVWQMDLERDVWTEVVSESTPALTFACVKDMMYVAGPSSGIDQLCKDIEDVEAEEDYMIIKMTNDGNCGFYRSYPHHVEVGSGSSPYLVIAERVFTEWNITIISDDGNTSAIVSTATRTTFRSFPPNFYMFQDFLFQYGEFGFFIHNPNATWNPDKWTPIDGQYMTILYDQIYRFGSYPKLYIYQGIIDAIKHPVDQISGPSLPYISACISSSPSSTIIVAMSSKTAGIVLKMEQDGIFQKKYLDRVENIFCTNNSILIFFEYQGGIIYSERGEEQISALPQSLTPVGFAYHSGFVGGFPSWVIYATSSYLTNIQACRRSIAYYCLPLDCHNTTIVNVGHVIFPVSQDPKKEWNLCEISEVRGRSFKFPNYAGIIADAQPGFNGSFFLAGRFQNSVDRVNVVTMTTPTSQLRSPSKLCTSVATSIFYHAGLFFVCDQKYAFFWNFTEKPQKIGVETSMKILGLFRLYPTYVEPEPFNMLPEIAIMVAVGGIALSIIGVVAWSLRRYRKKDPKVEYIEIRSTEPLQGNFPEDRESIGKTLARGAYGVVSEVRHPNGGIYAAKTIAVTEEHIKELAMKEIEILTLLQHKNTICLRGSQISQKEIVIYTDLFNGSVQDLYSSSRQLEFKDVVLIATGLAKALQYVHSMKIVHRDIKPSNVLLDMRGSKWIKSVHLADFGVATFVGEDGQLPGDIVGTVPYLAPEIGKTDFYDAFSADVYSFGVSIWEVCNARNFPRNFKADISVLLKQEMKPMKKLIRKCTLEIPEERWSVLEILQFLRKIEDQDVMSS